MQTQDWIKTALKAKGHKLKDVAITLGITSPRVTDILQGKRGVQAEELMPLAKLLGIGVQSLLKSLEAGERILLPGDGTAASLPVLGQITGNGTLLPISAAMPQSVPLPPDAEKADGLYCYIMGDNSMAEEIKCGDIIIAADPRTHFYPMVPGAIFLVKGPDETLAARQYMQSDSGDSWLVALPETPDPALENWRFTMLPDALMSDSTASTTSAKAEKNTEMPTKRIVRTDDIFAAVLWVHRRYMPATNV